MSKFVPNPTDMTTHYATRGSTPARNLENVLPNMSFEADDAKEVSKKDPAPVAEVVEETPVPEPVVEVSSETTDEATTQEPSGDVSEPDSDDEASDSSEVTQGEDGDVSADSDDELEPIGYSAAELQEMDAKVLREMCGDRNITVPPTSRKAMMIPLLLGLSEES